MIRGNAATFAKWQAQLALLMEEEWDSFSLLEIRRIDTMHARLSRGIYLSTNDAALLGKLVKRIKDNLVFQKGEKK